MFYFSKRIIMVLNVSSTDWFSETAVVAAVPHSCSQGPPPEGYPDRLAWSKPRTLCAKQPSVYSQCD